MTTFQSPHYKDTIPKIRNKNPNSYNHVSVSDLYVYSPDRSAYSAAGKQMDQMWEYTDRPQTQEIRTETAQFLFWENKMQISCSAVTTPP
jgi:hypothetical protein